MIGNNRKSVPLSLLLFALVVGVTLVMTHRSPSPSTPPQLEEPEPADTTGIGNVERPEHLPENGEPEPEPEPTREENVSGSMVQDPVNGADNPLEDYVLIPAGTFLQGAPADEEGRLSSDSLPREVEITRPFLLKATPVTQGQWEQAFDANPSRFWACGANCPVERVTWYEALVYLNWLSEQEGLELCYELSRCGARFSEGCGNMSRCGLGFGCASVEFKGLDCEGYRLPTEAEWEYAARAGTTTATYAGDLQIDGYEMAPLLDDVAVYRGNSGVDYSPAADCSDWQGRQVPSDSCGTQEVGSKRPNDWGLYDMFGNVRNWTQDLDTYRPLEPGRQIDPLAADIEDLRAQDLLISYIARGCNWFNSAKYCRASVRGGAGPNRPSDRIGFRPARTIKP